MKQYFLILLLIALSGCNPVPNKSVLAPLTVDELAGIQKRDTLFSGVYVALQKIGEKLNDIEKARYTDVTYRKFYKMVRYIDDTTVWNPLQEKWTTEWDKKYGAYSMKVDSVLNFWRQYKEKNSLSRFVEIKFVSIDKEYYSYSYDVKSVDLGFLLTPLQGKIDQVKFNYRYSAKIDKSYGEKYNCISTAPFAKPVIRYWKADYKEESILKHKTTSSFIRDYDIYIEITDVRKDGVNYSLADLNIPKSVEGILDVDSTVYPHYYAYYKNLIISEVICSDYLTLDEYIGNQKRDILQKEYPREYAYIENLAK